MRRKRKILVIDDDAEITGFLRELFSGDGYEVDVEAKSREAYDKFTSGGYDLVAVDVNMPYMDGENLCVKVLEASSDMDVPAIIMSGSGLDPSFISAVKKEKNVFIAKPAGIDMIRRKVRHLLSGPAKKGMTLTELVMVLGIVVVLGLIVVPNIAGLVRSWDLEAESRKLRAVIRDARQAAIAKRDVHRIYFDTAADTYDVVRDPGGVDEDTVTYALTPGTGLTSTTFSAAGENSVSFNVFGAPSEGGTVTLADGSGDTRTVSVTAVTGKVKVE